MTVLYPDKKQMLERVSLSRNTVADRVCEMATDLRLQLSERSCIALSLAVASPGSLAIFIHGVDSNLRVTEESIHATTTGNDIIENACQSVTETALGHTYWT